MKIGIYYAFWEHEWRGDYHAYIDRVADLGFDILEVSCVSLPTDKESLYSLRDHAKDRGIILTGGHGPGPNGSMCSPDPDITANGKRELTGYLRQLELLGASIVGGGLYGYWPADYSKPIHKARDWDIAVKNIREMAHVAADCGVTLCMETLNRFEGYLINTSAECRKFVEEVDHPNVGIMLDTFHMNIEEDSFYDAILTAGDLLRHFHLGEANRRVPGKGRLPWKEIGAALNAISYDGGCVMEPFVMQGGTIGTQIRVWREVEQDISQAALDADAKRSLDFTRYMFSSN